MGDLSQEEREQLVRKEFEELNRFNYINDKDYQFLLKSYQKLLVRRKKETSQAEFLLDGKNEVVSNVEIKKQSQPKKEKRKKQLSMEQIRERNISWSLILGVVLMLIGGLVLATSNWEQMGPGLRVFAISCVAIIFLMLSGISSKFLKIEKTAFAFLTLGSLLIPIVIVAIGYFELFGSYLSLTGEGRYYLGLIGTLIPLPLYVRSAIKHNSRLFVWISYLFLSFTVAFLIASTGVSIDAFYLLIMIFNAILLYIYHLVRTNQRFTIFLKELPAYSQLNLVISTLLMLFIYNQAVFYSFNLLLTAAIYIAMVYVYNTKEYHFVFSVLFAYGVYQLVDHTRLENIDFVIYSLVGLVYICFAYVVRNNNYLKRMFRFTSGLISFFAFIYVSYQGILLKADEPSLLLLASYVLIALNYAFLAYLTYYNLFKYLASFFIIVTGYQLWESTNHWFKIDNPDMFMFIYGVVLFLVVGVFNNNKYLHPIKKSSYYLSIILMVVSIVYGVLLMDYIKASLLLILFSLVAFVVTMVTSQGRERKIAEWVHAISILVALLIIYPKLTSIVTDYQTYFNLPFHYGVTGLILLAISQGWSRIKKSGLSNASFYTGQFAYLYGLLVMLSFSSIDANIVRPLLLFVGIFVCIWLVIRSKQVMFWLLVAITSFAFFGSLLSPLPFDTLQATILYLMFGPVILLVIETFVGRKVKELRHYFFWFAQLILFLLIIVVIVDSIFGSRINPLVLFIPLVVYVYSTIIKAKEWQIKGFLYAAMTLVPILLTMVVDYFNLLKQMPSPYLWVIASVVMAVSWMFVNQTWRTRMEWYIIPFSLVGLYIVIMERQMFPLIELFSILGYVVYNLYFLHKRNYYTFTIIPLALTFVMWEQERYLFDSITLYFVCIVSYFVHLIAGYYLFEKLYNLQKDKSYVDWYSIVAVFYLVYSISFISEQDNIIVQITPILLLTVWFFGQVNRLNNLLLKLIFKTLGVLGIIPAYLLLLKEYQAWIPDLIKAEITVLPILGISIFLSLQTWKGYKKLMGKIQLIVLLLVTGYLVIDAIESQTVWDAIVIGGLSLFSIVIGMQYRIKAYFFVGIGVLVFNVMYQTKSYWGNMPWWGYLLIAGSTLIGIASYHEWRKQRPKNNEGKMKRKLKQFLSSLKEWD
ncbi:hypothetical protein [Aquibacillus saliphilus]|uniref:hypothetical protein n=1 Tax=Aquibacillus saliphilus TaxID=1909422 RepID=UPI001CF043CA|nr:hypothetical protein [Aquibacillus saliphilus]